MVVKGRPPRAALSRLRGAFTVHYLSHGRVSIHAWPVRRGEPRSPVTRDQVAIWDMVLEMIKRAPSPEVSIALAATKGTAFYAKDILIAAAYGNYISFPGWGQFPNGPVGGPVAS